MRNIPLKPDRRHVCEPRRGGTFFRQSGFGIGAAALAGLLNPSLFAGATPDTSANPLAPKRPCFRRRPRA